MTPTDSAPYVKVRSLSVSYGQSGITGKKRVTAVRRVTFDVKANSCFALVGESGSGKTTVARALLNLARIDAGTVQIGQFKLPGLPRRAVKAYRREVQAVFQDPYLALNPRHNVARIIEEPLIIHGIPSARRKERVRQVLNQVRLAPDCLARRPGQLSGGQRQRVCIARSLVLEPGLLIADEPVSALDLSVQGQVVDLLNDLRRESGLTLLFVSHDVELVQFMADTVGVMYAGRLVELGPADNVLSSPMHPYTRSLLASTPGKLLATGLKAGVPAAAQPGAIGCPFREQCEMADMKCEFEEAPLIMVDPDHRVACFKTAGGPYR